MMTAPIRCALKRGAFHALAGLILSVALLFLPYLIVVIALAIITAIYLSFEVARLRVPSVNRWFISSFAPLLRDKEKAKLTGSSYFLIGCLVTVLIFPRDIAALAILFVSLGDPAATIVGTWKGRIIIRGRSMEGHTACLVTCLVISFVLSTTLDGVPLIVVVAGAIIATLFEALPLPISDNLTIPMGSALAMSLIGLLV